MRRAHWALLVFPFFTPSLRAQDLFAERIRPLLEKRCASCHNPEAKMSGLDVTSREALLRGGKQGADVVPGKSAESRVYQFVAARKMPPTEALPTAEAEALRQWIDAGASWSGPVSIHKQRARAGADWWALQPDRKSVV